MIFQNRNMFKVSKTNGKKRKTKHQNKASKISTTEKSSKVENVETPVGPYGFTPEGEKKRILLDAFDMNGIGHTRFAESNSY